MPTTVKQLRAELRKRKLKISGSKNELVARLNNAKSKASLKLGETTTTTTTTTEVTDVTADDVSQNYPLQVRLIIKFNLQHRSSGDVAGNELTADSSKSDPDQNLRGRESKQELNNAKSRENLMLGETTATATDVTDVKAEVSQIYPLQVGPIII